MKLKKIEKLCKSAGNVILCDEEAVVDESEDDVTVAPIRQWMGDGGALYPLDGVPYLNEEAVYAIFDVNAKQAEKLRVSYYEQLPADLCFTDFCAGEELLEPVKLTMSLGGVALHLLRDSAGALLVIKDEYRAPFDNWKDCECYKRVTERGTAYVAVKSGCVLRGVIMQYNCIDADFVEALGAVYNAAGVAAAAKKEGKRS